jgi:hypothetical protein
VCQDFDLLYSDERHVTHSRGAEALQIYRLLTVLGLADYR